VETLPATSRGGAKGVIERGGVTKKRRKDAKLTKKSGQETRWKGVKSKSKSENARRRTNNEEKKEK